MTWDGAQYVFTITTPEPVRFDAGEVADAPEVEADEPADPAPVPEIIRDARGGY